MDILRTPESRFANLPGYPFAPHYVDVSAADTTPPQSYLDYCFFTHLPSTLDLVILEFGSMAASASFPGVETFSDRTHPESSNARRAIVGRRCRPRAFLLGALPVSAR